MSANTATPSQPFDPIRFCVFTTVAIIAWVFGAPFAVMLMSGLGLAAYIAAYRSGLRETKCFLRDTRLVIAYLGIAFLAGLAFTVLQIYRTLT